MNIVVCIKQVPDVLSIRIDQERMTIIREGVESVINPLDCVALETALALKEKEGGTVTVLSMGPPQSEEALREALAAGADRGVLLTDRAFAGADTLATSHALAAAIRKLDPAPDLILCGRQTSDSDTGHVGPQIAEELDLPQVCQVNEIHTEQGGLVVRRTSDGFVDLVRVSLPALLTVSYEMTGLRSIPLGNIERAFSGGGITCWTAADLGLEPDEVGLNGSPTRVVKMFTPPPRGKAEMVTGTTPVLVERLIKKLESLTILDEEAQRE